MYFCSSWSNLNGYSPNFTSITATGTCITVVSWLHDTDPFPGPSDVFFSAFYPAMLVAALYHITVELIASVSKPIIEI